MVFFEFTRDFGSVTKIEIFSCQAAAAPIGTVENMASKRATNNSTIVNLDQQSTVIEEVLTQAGIGLPKTSKGNSEKIKTVQKKKAKKAEQTTFRSGLAGTVAVAASVPDEMSQATPHCAAPANRSRAVPEAALGRAPSAELGHVNQDEVPGNEPGDAVGHDDQPSNGAPGSGAAGGHAPLGGPAMAGLLGDQQHWFWPQGPTFPLHYGNFLPHFGLGGGVMPPIWDQEEEEVPAERRRQQTHEMSEDEEDEAPLAQEGEDEGRQAEAAVPRAAGKTAELLKEKLDVVRDCDKVADKVSPDVANLLDRFLLEANSLGDMEKLAKQYPRVENVERMKVPRLDEEVFSVIDQRHKTSDQSFQAIQRALMASMSALAGVMELGYRRGSEDPELDELGLNVMNSLQLQAHAHNALLNKRRELLKPELSPVYAKELSKSHSSSSDWLYGGDLLDATKKCEAAKKIGEKIAKRKVFPANKGPQKRFKHPFPANFAPHYQQQQGAPMLRAFNPYQHQVYRFPTPQYAQQQYQAYPSFQPTQFGVFSRRPRNPRAQGQKSGFNKRGGYRQ